MGNNIPAARIGLITKDIRGTDNIEIGPAKPPFAIPKKNTPSEAKIYIDISI